MAQPNGAPAAAKAFCKAVLPRVSRTFALNIRLLPPAMAEAVGVGYLICRILDTVEDAATRDRHFKAPLLKSFPSLLENPGLPAQGWFDTALLADMTDGERDLLANGPQVLAVFHGLAPAVQKAMIPPITRMAEGMALTVERTPDGGRLHLVDHGDLLRYCYFVAGTVGELLTALFQDATRDAGRKKVLHENAVAFGNGLQLVNILKDFRSDSGRGVCYIPAAALRAEAITLDEFFAWKNPEANRRILGSLVDLAAGELEGALAYTRALPKFPMGYRRFCLVALMLAMETLALLNQEWQKQGSRVKVGRAVVRRVLLWTPLYALSDFLLVRAFQRLMKKVRSR